MIPVWASPADNNLTGERDRAHALSCIIVTNPRPISQNLDLVDEAVLSQGLNHHHPLSTQFQQDFWDIQRLKRTDY